MARIDTTFGRPELAAVRDAANHGDLRALGSALAAGLTTAHDRLDRVKVAVDTLTAQTGASVLAASTTGFAPNRAAQPPSRCAVASRWPL